MARLLDNTRFPVDSNVIDAELDFSASFWSCPPPPDAATFDRLPTSGVLMITASATDIDIVVADPSSAAP
jgi:hypothetical protein